jgi:hypothetical protein
MGDHSMAAGAWLRSLVLFGCVVGGGLLPQAAQAQEADPPAACSETHHLFKPVPDACLGDIVTDRPHKTDTPAILAAGHAQAEIGVVEYGFSPKKHDVVTAWNTQVKLGLHDSVEIGAFYAPVVTSLAAPSWTFSRDYAVRAKWLLFQSQDEAFAVTLVPYAEATGRKFTGAGGSLFAGYDFASGLELELNVGYTAVIGGHDGGVIATTALTQPVWGDVAAFFELWTESFVHSSERSSTLDLGLLYLVTRDVQVDGGVYWKLYGDVPLATFFLGTSLRL